jgi:phytanoyl-CoA hydroxylase
MLLTDSQKEQYVHDGFLLIHGALRLTLLDRVERDFLQLVERWGGCRFESVQSSEFSQFLLGNRDLERRLYDGIREFPWLTEFGKYLEIAQPVSELMGGSIGLLSKIPFRIDLPFVTRELAVWHQDYFYVKGNTDIITAWIPLQDTPYIRGCLMVMPGSQDLGVLDHDQEVLGKRHFPAVIFEHEVRYVEMQRGDILLFHSLLLHSSGLNMSPTPRLSIQARYSALFSPIDPSMGQVIPV